MSRHEPSLSNLRRGFREFWLLLRRRPPEDRGWRDFWITWVPAFLPFLLVLVIIDPPFFSVTMLVALLGMAVWSFVLSLLFRRLGLIGRSGSGRSA